MSQIIAGIYEIQQKIGAGGGGIVYLGEHTHLHKKIVLKADKRKLSAGEEALRREVDLLKNLSHTYIPQVYDFVQEDGVVYTVMDFIEGESLDKLLKRNERPSQPDVIKWACQLLEALSYIHNQPPHGILHGDIKPANIMLRPNGDVCLIDFNIALALGEEGAVKVGFSRGYASPEHYGMVYTSESRGARTRHSIFRKNRTVKTAKNINTAVEKTLVLPNDNDKTIELGGINEDSDKTLALDDSVKDNDKTLALSGQAETSSALGSSQGVSKPYMIMLDVRSDIYSLGATFYHLLSGKRPPENALEVEPLGEEICSRGVSEILRKAMAPEADMRYQTAEEMRDAFLRLYETDRRVIHFKKCRNAAVAVCGAAFLLGGAGTFVGLKQLEQYQQALALSEYSANELTEGDVTGAVRLAMQALPDEKSIFSAKPSAQAQLALTNALGVYNLTDGFNAYNTITLPAAPFDMALSPSGSRLAVVYAYEAAVYGLEEQEKIVSLTIQESALSDIRFVGEDKVIYAGSQGVAVYDLNSQSALWTGEAATAIAVSGDCTTAAAVDRASDRAVIYRVSDGEVLKELSFEGLSLNVPANDVFADAGDYIFELNEDGSLLAVSLSSGGLRIFDLRQPDNDLIVYDESDYTHFEGGFCGGYFAFSAQKSGESEFALIDTKKAEYAGGYTSQDNILVKADRRGIYCADKNLLVNIDLAASSENELAYTDNANISAFDIGEKHILAVTDDARFSFYDSAGSLMSSEECDIENDFALLAGEFAVLGNRNEPELRILKLEDHSDAQLAYYAAGSAHDEARVSSDMQTVMLFSYKGFQIYDMDGGFITQEELPDTENIYDQQFRREGGDSLLEVIWYDGTVRRYSARDGSLISETKEEAPDRMLYEEFFTDKYRIVSELHSAPKVYALDSEKLLAELEEESYLTYVTQVGEYIITEYISTEGKRYGILLDEDFEKLAYLPGLCDIVGDMLVFDDNAGNLRQCRLYSLQELTALGETYLSTH